MLDKCANPSCSTPLIYLREGKIFFLEHHPQSQVHLAAPVAAKSAGRIEHFWLCGPCSAEMTVTYNDAGVAVIPKNKTRQAAA